MQPDIEKYRPYVDGFDLTEDQKVELIHTVWHIMESFVDRAFGMDSTQAVLALRDQEDSRDWQERLEFLGQLSIPFKSAAAQEASDYKLEAYDEND